MRRLDRLGPDFDDFVRSSSADLLRVATLLTGDRGAAEDLLQVALVRTAARWTAARHNPKAYARQAVVNLTKNRWRDRSRRPQEAHESAAAEPFHDAADDRIVQRDAVSKLIAQLPLGQRKALVLRYFEDLSVAEVAEILGCSEGTVKSQSNRALAALRRLLAGPSTSTSIPTEVGSVRR